LYGSKRLRSSPDEIAQGESKGCGRLLQLSDHITSVPGDLLVGVGLGIADQKDLEGFGGIGRTKGEVHRPRKRSGRLDALVDEGIVRGTLGLVDVVVAGDVEPVDRCGIPLGLDNRDDRVGRVGEVDAVAAGVVGQDDIDAVGDHHARKAWLTLLPHPVAVGVAEDHAGRGRGRGGRAAGEGEQGEGEWRDHGRGLRV
jgi:hypothetical protein